MEGDARAERRPTPACRLDARAGWTGVPPCAPNLRIPFCAATQYLVPRPRARPAGLSRTWGVYGQATRTPRRTPLLLSEPANGGRVTPPKRAWSAAPAWCTATRSWRRSSAVMIRAPAVRDAGFKRCCLSSG